MLTNLLRSRSRLGLRLLQQTRRPLSSGSSNNNVKYLKSHEYINLTSYEIGITDFAQDQLGDVVYIDLPEEGDEFKKGEIFGTVESVKTAADVYMPISGKVLSVNENLADTPELVNTNPLDKGFFIKIEPSNLEEDLKSSELLDEANYQTLLETLK